MHVIRVCVPSQNGPPTLIELLVKTVAWYVIDISLVWPAFLSENVHPSRHATEWVNTSGRVSGRFIMVASMESWHMTRVSTSGKTLCHYICSVFTCWMESITLALRLPIEYEPWFTLQWRHNESQVTGVSMVCSTICSGAHQSEYQSSVSLAFVGGIHRWPVDSPHKGSNNAENAGNWWRHHEQCETYPSCIKHTDICPYLHI